MGFLNQKKVFEKYIFQTSFLFLGRRSDWLVCALPEDSLLSTGILGCPFYDTITDPFTAYRVDTPTSEWNSNHICALYPVTLTRLNRIINVIVPQSDLYPVFSDSSLSSLDEVHF